MPRHAFIGRSATAAESLARHQVVHTRVEGNRFRIGGDEENLARAELALGVLFGTLHGEWQTIPCGGIRLERDPTLPAPAPRVFFFAVNRIVGISPAALARFGDRPAWYHRKEATARSTLFTRFPEPPIEGPEVDEVIGVLTNGIQEMGPSIMTLVGRTPTMRFGFHTAATYEQALTSFTEDGFELVTGTATATWAGVEWPAALVRDLG